MTSYLLHRGLILHDLSEHVFVYVYDKPIDMFIMFALLVSELSDSDYWEFSELGVNLQVHEMHPCPD